MTVKKNNPQSTESENPMYKFGINLNDMMKSGLHLGHVVTKLHPKMASFVVGVKGNMHIIDLGKTAVLFEKALTFLGQIVKEGGTILFVGTRPPVRNIIREIAKEVNMPYVVNRWLGGTFTNFETILRGIKRYKELQKKEKDLAEYTKKERVHLAKRIEKLKVKFEGLEELQKLPEAIFVCDVNENILAVKEARKKGIKIIAITDTDSNPELIDYPIPASDNSIPALKYILGKIKEVIKKNRPVIK